MEEIKQYPTKKRIEFLRNVEDAGVKELVRQIDACTDRKTLAKIDRDEYEIAPNLRGMKDQGGMDLFWTVADLRRQKESALNKIEREAKAAAKLQKETTKTAEKDAATATLKRRMELPVLKGVLDKLGQNFYLDIVLRVTDSYTLKISKFFTDDVFNQVRPNWRDRLAYESYQNTFQDMAPFMLRGERLDPNWKEIVAKMAKDTAQYWVDVFKAKLATKLGEIIDVKGQADIAIVGNVHEYTLKVNFHDGSYFTIRTQQVLSTSCKGKLFARYPSTFHDVRFTDGSKMSVPSAAKMQKEFGININEKEE